MFEPLLRVSSLGDRASSAATQAEERKASIAAALRGSIGRAAYAFADKPVGPRECVGNDLRMRWLWMGLTNWSGVPCTQPLEDDLILTKNHILS